MALFKRKKKNNKSTYTIYEDKGSLFRAGGSVYENEQFMSAVYAHARHFSAIKFMHYVGDTKGKPALNRILTLRPNPLTNASTFWEKVATDYYINTNVFVYLERDERLDLKALWVLDPSNTTVQRLETGEIYLRFYLNNVEHVESLDSVVHLARNVDVEDFLGDGNGAISRTLKLIDTNYVGIENALKTSAFLRFLIKTARPLHPDEQERRVRQFAKNYLDPTTSVGVGYLDNGDTVEKLESNQKYLNHEDSAFFDEKVNRYLGITNAVITNSAIGDAWQAYYHGALAPLASKLCDELTYKLFTDPEIDKGNSVIAEVDSIGYATLAARVNLVAVTKELGVYSINEYRAMLTQSEPVEGGEVRESSLNYVQADKKNDYQEIEEEDSQNE